MSWNCCVVTYKLTVLYKLKWVTNAGKYSVNAGPARKACLTVHRFNPHHWHLRVRRSIFSHSVSPFIFRNVHYWSQRKQKFTTRTAISVPFMLHIFLVNHSQHISLWNRDGGVKGLFTGVGPRVARAGPSVGIVVSFYEVVKYTLHHRYHQFTKWKG